MTWLFENPVPLIIITVIGILLAIAGLVATGKRVFIGVALILALIGGGFIAVERMIITPMEEVRGTLDQIAIDLESNNVESVISHVSDNASDIQSDIRARLHRVDVQQIKIKSNLKVTFAETRGQEVAMATFNAVAYASMPSAGEDRSRPVPKFVTLNFCREGERWKISSYELSDPREGMGAE